MVHLGQGWQAIPLSFRCFILWPHSLGEIGQVNFPVLWCQRLQTERNKEVSLERLLTMRWNNARTVSSTGLVLKIFYLGASLLLFYTELWGRPSSGAVVSGMRNCFKIWSLELKSSSLGFKYQACPSDEPWHWLTPYQLWMSIFLSIKWVGFTWLNNTWKYWHGVGHDILSQVWDLWWWPLLLSLSRALTVLGAPPFLIAHVPLLIKGLLILPPESLCDLSAFFFLGSPLLTRLRNCLFFPWNIVMVL